VSSGREIIRLKPRRPVSGDGSKGGVSSTTSDDPRASWVLVTESKAKDIIATRFFQENLKRSFEAGGQNFLQEIHETMYHLTYDVHGKLSWLVPQTVADEVHEKAKHSRVNSEKTFLIYAKFLEKELNLTPTQGATYADRLGSQHGQGYRGR
jgi:hypothetical protein